MFLFTMCRRFNLAASEFIAGENAMDGKSSIVKLVIRWNHHWRLWQSFQQVVSHCRKVGSTVMLEWLRFCDYWQEKRVDGLFKHNELSCKALDGCIDGVKSKYGSPFERTMSKFWKIAYMNPRIK